MCPDCCHRVTLEERASGRVLFALIHDPAFDDWLLVDALQFTEYGIQYALDRWFAGRTRASEQEEDITQLRDDVPYPEIQAAQVLAYRTTIALLQEICGEVPSLELPGWSGPLRTASSEDPSVP